MAIFSFEKDGQSAPLRGAAALSQRDGASARRGRGRHDEHAGYPLWHGAPSAGQQRLFGFCGQSVHGRHPSAGRAGVDQRRQPRAVRSGAFCDGGDEIDQGSRAGRRAGDCRGRARGDGYADADPDGQARDEQVYRGKRRHRREDVAEEVFRSDPEREAIIEQVSRQIQEEQLEPVIPVENKRVVAQLQRVKIKTDNGISITLPRELADDENSFAVVENGDGTISIIINKVQELKTE